MKSFIDPAINRKSNIVDDALVIMDDKTPLPSVVEVSESGTCNRVCSFCPRSVPDFPDVKEFIDKGLIEKLATQLSEVGFKGIFLFSGFVEPLLDKNIYNLISIVRKALPNVKIEAVTNGDVLNESRLQKLFDSGLSTILISAYDSKEQAEDFEKLCTDIGLSAKQYVVRPRYLPPEQDFGITLSNRAGMMDNAEFSIVSPANSLAEPCYYPHYTFFMDYLGDVLLCPHDWGKKKIVGNMLKQDFLEIWNSTEMYHARQLLVSGNRRFLPCDKCDVKGMLMGKKHIEAWYHIYEKKDTNKDH